LHIYMYIYGTYRTQKELKSNFDLVNCVAS